MEYQSRFVDKALAERLNSSGAVLIEGPKGCGKTETALQLARSAVSFTANNQIELQMQIDPRRVLDGDTPRLLDEWQEHPAIWDYVRSEVDRRKLKGQFILTGSATPDDQARRHSGVGRFSVVKMRTMSLFEKGWSSGEVSLGSLMHNEAPVSELVDFNIDGLCEKITLGGWPGLLGEDSSVGLQFVSDYVLLTAEVDLSRVSDKRRDPFKVMRLLQSIARNISTEAPLRTLAKDINSSSDDLNPETVTDYLSALQRLMVLDDLPAWSTHIRSTHTLRKSPKRHFSDPSLAVGALGLSVGQMAADLNYLGLLFESLAVRDLRVYADTLGGKVYHYRDSAGLEVDAIIELPDGSWGAFEVKLGIGAADEAASNLLRFAQRIDTERAKAASALTVITGNGFAHRRPDGVNVVPLYTLTA
ncbi:MAG: DUF4143 domain-containing protein [Coriobacteriia bacterium]|nr:DUF4143 domain-containing protein [Coriobacteriia bacterium]